MGGKDKAVEELGKATREDEVRLHGGKGSRGGRG